ncbi:hypothetical protein FOL47_004852 [Perkinsus chesapeaki]|uniref:Uncharacterized protein n=1 Tax=Perkinsus chesapeaki TaxID=330153 RepID=A0A7J6M0G8_PERCH|nr:hypothetical protein FOL47_004852 [Perkinsus chesapeaki]
MILAVITLFQLLSKSSSSSFASPEGIYQVLNPMQSGVRVLMDFSSRGSVYYLLYDGYSNRYSHGLFPWRMVSPSVISVDVPESELVFWKEDMPTRKDLSLQVLFYDAVRDIITVNDSIGAFDIASNSARSENSSPVVDVSSPYGVYRSVDPSIDITMKFNDGRASYRFSINGVSYSFPSDVDFQMKSSSLISVSVPRSQLDDLHANFPELSVDDFYMSLGYDPVRDEITFLLESRRSVILKLSNHLPLGDFTSRSWPGSFFRLKLTFFEDSTVKYTIHSYGPLNTRDNLSFPASMVSSSVISVTVPQDQLAEWKGIHANTFDDSGLQIFFYDRLRKRITFVGLGYSFETLHSSEPAEDPGSVANVRKPEGIYRSSDWGINITMLFNGSRVFYRFNIDGASYSFPFEVDFQMMSSSLIRVWLPRSQLYGLHGKFPGLSLDFFYMNLGYDYSRDEITFLLESWRAVILSQSYSEPSSFYCESYSAKPKSAITTITTTTSTTTTSTTSVSNLPFYSPISGEYCADENTAKMSLRFENQYVVTFAAVYRDTHILARRARYDVIKENGQVIISVDAVNSDLNEELLKMDWQGITRLDFIFDPVRNIVMLEKHGLIGHMFIGFDCAAAIEAPPAEPHGGGGGGYSTDDDDDDGDADLTEFFVELLRLLSRR